MSEKKLGKKIEGFLKLRESSLKKLIPFILVALILTIGFYYVYATNIYLTCTPMSIFYGASNTIDTSSICEIPSPLGNNYNYSWSLGDQCDYEVLGSNPNIPIKIQVFGNQSYIPGSSEELCSVTLSVDNNTHQGEKTVMITMKTTSLSISPSNELTMNYLDDGGEPVKLKLIGDVLFADSNYQWELISGDETFCPDFDGKTGEEITIVPKDKFTNETHLCVFKVNDIKGKGSAEGTVTMLPNDVPEKFNLTNESPSMTIGEDWIYLDYGGQNYALYIEDPKYSSEYYQWNWSEGDTTYCPNISGGEGSTGHKKILETKNLLDVEVDKICILKVTNTYVGGEAYATIVMRSNYQSPLPPVEGVNLYDNPDDHGGKLVVEWTPYNQDNYGGIFKEYQIWLSGSPIDNNFLDNTSLNGADDVVIWVTNHNTSTVKKIIDGDVVLTKNTGYSELRGIETDEEGNVFFVGNYNYTKGILVKMDPDGTIINSTLTYVNPYKIFLDNQGSVWVHSNSFEDDQNSMVERFDASDLTRIGSPWPSCPQGRGIYVDDSLNVYVVCQNQNETSDSLIRFNQNGGYICGNQSLDTVGTFMDVIAHKNYIWVLNKSGLIKFDKTTCLPYNIALPDSFIDLEGDGFHSMVLDKDEQIWITNDAAMVGVQRGVYVYDINTEYRNSWNYTTQERYIDITTGSKGMIYIANYHEFSTAGVIEMYNNGNIYRTTDLQGDGPWGIAVYEPISEEPDIPVHKGTVSDITQNDFLIKNLDRFTPYYVAVVGVPKYGLTSEVNLNSKDGSAIPKDNIPPNPVDNLDAVLVLEDSKAEICLTWDYQLTDPDDNIEGYYVLRSRQRDSPSSYYNTSELLPVSTKKFCDDVTNVDVDYFYNVIATDGTYNISTEPVEVQTKSRPYAENVFISSTDDPLILPTSKLFCEYDYYDPNDWNENEDLISFVWYKNSRGINEFVELEWEVGQKLSGILDIGDIIKCGVKVVNEFNISDSEYKFSEEVVVLGNERPVITQHNTSADGKVLNVGDSIDFYATWWDFRGTSEMVKLYVCSDGYGDLDSNIEDQYDGGVNYTKFGNFKNGSLKEVRFYANKSSQYVSQLEIYTERIVVDGAVTYAIGSKVLKDDLEVTNNLVAHNFTGDFNGTLAFYDLDGSRRYTPGEPIILNLKEDLIYSKDDIILMGSTQVPIGARLRSLSGPIKHVYTTSDNQSISDPLNFNEGIDIYIQNDTSSSVISQGDTRRTIVTNASHRSITTPHIYSIHVYSVDEPGGEIRPENWRTSDVKKSFTVGRYNKFTLNYESHAELGKYLAFRICVDRDGKGGNTKTGGYCEPEDTENFVYVRMDNISVNRGHNITNGSNDNIGYNPEIIVRYGDGKEGCLGTKYCEYPLGSDYTSNEKVSCTHITKDSDKPINNYYIKVCDKPTGVGDSLCSVHHRGNFSVNFPPEIGWAKIGSPDETITSNSNLMCLFGDVEDKYLDEMGKGYDIILDADGIKTKYGLVKNSRDENLVDGVDIYELTNETNVIGGGSIRFISIDGTGDYKYWQDILVWDKNNDGTYGEIIFAPNPIPGNYELHNLTIDDDLYYFGNSDTHYFPGNATHPGDNIIISSNNTFNENLIYEVSWFRNRTGEYELIDNGNHDVLVAHHIEENDDIICQITAYDNFGLKNSVNSTKLKIGDFAGFITPKINSISTNTNQHNPVNEDDEVIFTVNWSYTSELNKEDMRLFICTDNNILTGDGCLGGETLVNLRGISHLEKPIVVGYNATNKTETVQTLYMMICDGANICSEVYGSSESPFSTSLYVNKRPRAGDPWVQISGLGDNRLLECRYNYDSSNNPRLTNDGDDTTKTEFRWYVDSGTGFELVSSQKDRKYGLVVLESQRFRCAVKVTDKLGLSDREFRYSSETTLPSSIPKPIMGEIPEVVNSNVTLYGYFDIEENITNINFTIAKGHLPLNYTSCNNISHNSMMNDTSLIIELPEGDNKGYFIVHSDDADKFNTNKFVKFENHDRDYFRFYSITSITKLTHNRHRINIYPDFEKPISVGEIVEIYKNDTPKNWFNCTIELPHEGLNLVIMRGKNSEYGQELEFEIYNDTIAPEIVPITNITETSDLSQEFKFNVSDDYGINLSRLLVNVTRSSAGTSTHVLHFVPETSYNITELTSQSSTFQGRNISCVGNKTNLSCSVQLTLLYGSATVNITAYDYVNLTTTNSTSFYVSPLTTRPTPVQVTIHGMNNVDRRIHATWTESTSPQGIKEYEYAIGNATYNASTPNSTRYVNWTSSGMNRTINIPLDYTQIEHGDVVYVHVRAIEDTNHGRRSDVSSNSTVYNTSNLNPRINIISVEADFSGINNVWFDGIGNGTTRVFLNSSNNVHCIYSWINEDYLVLFNEDYPYENCTPLNEISKEYIPRGAICNLKDYNPDSDEYDLDLSKGDYTFYISCNNTGGYNQKKSENLEFDLSVIDRSKTHTVNVSNYNDMPLENVQVEFKKKYISYMEETNSDGIANVRVNYGDTSTVYRLWLDGIDTRIDVNFNSSSPIVINRTESRVSLLLDYNANGTTNRIAMKEENDWDVDGDSINYSEDAILGHAIVGTRSMYGCAVTANNPYISPIDGCLLKVNISVDGSYDLNKTRTQLNGTYPVVIYSGESEVLRFNWNFSKGPLDLFKLKIEKDNAPSGRVMVNAEQLLYKTTKDISVDKTIANSNKVCVFDIAGVTSADYPGRDKCEEPGKLIVCDGTEQHGYTCENLTTILKVTNLQHSFVKQVNDNLCTLDSHCEGDLKCLSSGICQGTRVDDTTRRSGGGGGGGMIMPPPNVTVPTPDFTPTPTPPRDPEPVTPRPPEPIVREPMPEEPEEPASRLWLLLLILTLIGLLLGGMLYKREEIVGYLKARSSVKGHGLIVPPEDEKSEKLNSYIKSISQKAQPKITPVAIPKEKVYEAPKEGIKGTKIEHKEVMGKDVFEKLQNYISIKRKEGFTNSEITKSLIAIGWPVKVIDSAMHKKDEDRQALVELEKFVSSSIKNGHSKEDIFNVLKSKGWEENIIDLVMFKAHNVGNLGNAKLYIKSELKKGVSEKKIKLTLKAVGWKEEDLGPLF